MTYRGSSRTHKGFISYDQSNSQWSIVDHSSAWAEIARALGCVMIGAVGWYLITVMAFV